MTKLVIGKDRVSVTETENYVSATSDAYKCSVTFSKDWEGLNRKIVFRAVVGSNVCDELYASVEAIAMSMKFAIPNKVFAYASQKIQVSAIGSRKGREESDGVVLRTPWTTIGRVIEGATYPCEPSPDDPNDPTPPSDIIPPGGTKDQVLAKASDDDYDFYWMSVSGLPIVTSAGVNAPIKSVMYFAGDLASIPEGWALCDGQNGTPDLRGKVIYGTTTDGTELSSGLSEGTAVPIHAFYPIMNLSAEPTGAPGKSAYEIDVEHGFTGTEEEWLDSLKGASAYELAVQAGFLGSQETFSNTLKTLASFPVVSGLTITSVKELPADGDGCYIFDNVTVGSHTFTRQIIYLSTTTPNHIHITLLSGTVYDFTTSTSETEAILVEDVYEQTIPIPTFTDVRFANRSDVFNRNALGTIHLVNSRFDLEGYSSVIQFINDIAYLERYSNDFTLYTQNGRWYSFTLGEEQRFVYKDSGTFRSPKAVSVPFDDTVAALGASNVQTAIETLAARPSGGGGSSTQASAADVSFNDTTAKIGATNVQGAVDSLADAMLIIKDKTFKNTSDLSEYSAGKTYRMINVRFLDSKNINIVTFDNDPVYLGSSLTIYTMDGYRFEIVADDQGNFISSTVASAFETAAPESLPFQIIENVTFTSFSAFENFGIANDEVFLAQNLSFKLPDASEYALVISGTDWVRANWSTSMGLTLYSTNATWRFEWDTTADNKPFTKIEKMRSNGPIDITTTDIASATDLKALCYGLDNATVYFHGSASFKVDTQSIQIKERLADVVIDSSTKTVKICFIDGSHYTLTYGDDGVFASWSFSQNGSEPAALDLDSYEVIETNSDSVIAVLPDGTNVYRHYMDLTVEITAKELTIANFPNVELISPITGILEIAGATELCSVPGSYDDFSYGLSYVKETGDIKLYSSLTSLSEKRLRLTIDYAMQETINDTESEVT